MGSYAIALLLDRIDRKVNGLIEQQTRIERAQEKLMATSTENKAALEAAMNTIRAALTGIQSDVNAIKSQITTGMTQADVDSVIGQLTQIATNAAALDAQTPTA
jgi:hypothetical protein